MAAASTLFDYDVRDPAGARIGTVEAVWEDERTGATEFLGVRAAWLAGRIHLVPFEGARVDEANRSVWVRWLEQQVRDAPSFEPFDTLRPDEEARVYAHFGMAGTARPPGSGAVPEARSEVGVHAHRALRHDEHLAPGTWGPRRP